jgi:hypothetical protein
MKNLNPIKARILRWLVVIFVCGIALTFSGCYGTYYISDAEYSDLRESHSSITYYQGNVYWGWVDGYYYYYGVPHYYPWYYYYTMLPPYAYHINTHVYINCNNGYFVYYGHRKKKFDNSKSGHFNTTVKVKNSRANINNKPSTHVCGYSCNDDCFGNNKNRNDNNKIYITPNRNHNTNPNKNTVNKNRNNNIKINKSNTNRNNKNTNTKRKPR